LNGALQAAERSNDAQAAARFRALLNETKAGATP
jgi:hypothetical protein